MHPRIEKKEEKKEEEEEEEENDDLSLKEKEKMARFVVSH
jgi:hypothetical protein